MKKALGRGAWLAAGASAGALLIGCLVGFAPGSYAPGPLKPRADRQMEAMGGFLDVMGKFLTFGKQWLQDVRDPGQALVFAVHGYEELYETKGSKAEGVSFLREMLSQCEDAGVRNTIRFAIKDALKDAGKTDDAIAEAKALIQENVERLKRK